MAGRRRAETFSADIWGDDTSVVVWLGAEDPNPCEVELVELQRARAHGTEVFVVWVQDLGTSWSINGNKEMARRLGADLAILSDTSTQIARAFGIYDMPGSMGPFSAHLLAAGP